MAGPQFAAPKSVEPSRPRRHFKLDEAIKTLPLVRRIVSDIVATHQQVVELQEKLEDLTGKPLLEVQRELEHLMGRMQEYLDELSDIGCELKDFGSGLVDFVGRHQGRDVCLCWKLGEPTIGHWHETSAGFSGRQPVKLLDESD